MKEGLASRAGSAGSSPNRITLLRDADGDGKPEVRETFLDGLNQPFGMALVGDDALRRQHRRRRALPLQEGPDADRRQGRADPGPAGRRLQQPLDAQPRRQPGRHEAVRLGRLGQQRRRERHGRGDAPGQHPRDRTRTARACGCSRAGCATRSAWTGSRETGALWTAVNERDELGDDLVPDYITSVARRRLLRLAVQLLRAERGPAAQGRAAGPGGEGDRARLALGSHTASLGLRLLHGDAFPEKYRGGAFVGQRGSWNRSEFGGYRVAFVPFKDGKPSGRAEDFLTGFIADETRRTAGRSGVARRCRRRAARRRRRRQHRLARRSR